MRSSLCIVPWFYHHEQMDAEHAKVEAVLEAQEKSKSVVALVETVGSSAQPIDRRKQSSRYVN